MKHHIIYVPGIGDQRALGQDKGIEWWHVLGVQGHYHPVGWATAEPFADKLTKLLSEIDSYLAQGDEVSLLGFSAGAGAVLNAFAERRDKITSVISVSGKLNSPDNTSPYYFAQNPAFRESLLLLQDNLISFTDEDKTKMLTLNPLLDLVVPLRDAIIPDVKRWRTFAFGHAMSIAVTLTIYAPFIARYVKKRARSDANSR